MIPRTNEKRIPRTKEKRGALQKKSGMVARTFADQFSLTYWGKKIALILPRLQMIPSTNKKRGALHKKSGKVALTFAD